MGMPYANSLHPACRRYNDCRRCRQRPV